MAVYFGMVLNDDLTSWWQTRNWMMLWETDDFYFNSDRADEFKGFRDDYITQTLWIKQLTPKLQTKPACAHLSNLVECTGIVTTFQTLIFVIIIQRKHIEFRSGGWILNRRLTFWSQIRTCQHSSSTSCHPTSISHLTSASPFLTSIPDNSSHPHPT